ncbi:MAG: OpgC family protein [Beijerinckiaceae bacterium]
MRKPNEIDFWRGFALVTIFINHIPGIYFERFTYRNVSLSDSAELFVFLAGWSLRFQVEGTAASLPPIGVFLRLSGRALNVYIAQLAITEIALALLAGASILIDAPFLLDWHNASAVFRDPVEAHVGLVLLLHQLGYFNILPLYVVLMAGAPFLALTFRYAPWALLPVSLAIYVAALANGLNLPTWPVEGTWFLNPFAWQLIFVLGFVLAGGTGLGRLVRRYRRSMFWCALPIVGLGVFIGLTRYSPEPLNVPDPKLFFVFDKTFLSPARLLHMLALTAVFAGSFGLINRFLPSCCAYFSMLGRHSLYVFCIASLLSLVGQIVRFTYGGLIATDAVMLIVGLIVMGMVAWISEWRDRLRTASAGLQVSPSASG